MGMVSFQMCNVLLAADELDSLQMMSRLDGIIVCAT
jgi:hypothetical protein